MQVALDLAYRPHHAARDENAGDQSEQQANPDAAQQIRFVTLDRLLHRLPGTCIEALAKAQCGTARQVNRLLRIARQQGLLIRVEQFQQAVTIGLHHAAFLPGAVGLPGADVPEQLDGAAGLLDRLVKIAFLLVEEKIFLQTPRIPERIEKSHGCCLFAQFCLQQPELKQGVRDKSDEKHADDRIADQYLCMEGGQCFHGVE